MSDQSSQWVAQHAQELIALRRELHQYPEPGYAEVRTTALIMRWLQRHDITARVLDGGTGVVAEIGSGPTVIALRADIDALPLPDTKQVPYRSQVEGMAHACGHDAHTAILLGAAAVLAQLGELPGRVRLIFQPAEETIPGGALTVMQNAGVLEDVGQIFALHCDPRLDAGRIGLRLGPITAACDRLEVSLRGPGGHTSRPQLTVDVVYALGRLITELPGLLSRRVDPRAALSLVWGSVHAGEAINAIAQSGRVGGTVRMLGKDAWDDTEPLVRQLVEEIVRPSGAQVSIRYERGVPPVVNDSVCVARQREAVVAALGAPALAVTEQSMGGEDFAWYLDQVPGALARLGVRPPAATESVDLHSSDFDIDENALALGVRYTVALAQIALAHLAQPGS